MTYALLEKSGLSVLDADPITDLLWQGAYPGQGAQALYPTFDVLVLCAQGLQTGNFQKELTVFRVPLVDVVPMRPGDVERAWYVARWTAYKIKQGRRALITCAAGLNRSGLVAALTLHLVTGTAGTEIAEKIKKKRLGALSNQDFEKYIQALPGREEKCI